MRQGASGEMSCYCSYTLLFGRLFVLVGVLKSQKKWSLDIGNADLKTLAIDLAKPSCQSAHARPKSKKTHRSRSCRPTGLTQL